MRNVTRAVEGSWPVMKSSVPMEAPGVQASAARATPRTGQTGQREVFEWREADMRGSFQVGLTR